VANLLLPTEADSAADIGVSQGQFRRQIASAIGAIRQAMGAGDFAPEAGMELAQRLLTSQFVIFVDPVIGRDTVRLGFANDAVNPPLLNQQLECGYSPFAPFRTLARALLEVARISIVAGVGNDIYDRVVISVANGEHLADNRPSQGLPGVTAWPDGHEPTADDLVAFNAATTAGLILPRGVSVLGLDLRKTVIRPAYVPASGGSPSAGRAAIFRTTGGGFFFTFTFKDNKQVRSSHHLLHTFGFCSDADLAELYRKVGVAFGLAAAPEVMPGEIEIVAPYPDAPIPEVDTTVGSSSYVFSCSVRSDYGMCGIFLDGSQVSGFKSMVTAQYTQVVLQRDMNAWQLWQNGTWQVPGSYNDYIAADINNVRLRVGGAYNAETGCYADDWRSFGFKCINDAIIQEVSCFVIGHSVHHWTASGGECTITNSNSNFGMTALLSSGFRGIGTGRGAFPQDRGFQGVAIRRALQIGQAGTNIRELSLGAVATYDHTTGVLTLDRDVDPALLSGYSLRPGSYLWVDNLSRETGPGAVPGDLAASRALPTRAQLASPAWVDTAPNQIRLVAATSNINTIDPAEIGGNRVYIRRLIDTRLPEQREVSMIVQSTSGGRRPLGNYVLRLSGKQAVAEQLDPTNGAEQVFLVSSSDVTELPGAPGTATSWKLVLRPGDSAQPFSTTGYYQIGEPVFASGRVQRAKRPGVYPAFEASSFEPSYSMMPDERGLEFGRAGIAPRIVIDTDNSPDPDSTTLGVDLLTDPAVIGQAHSSADYVAMEQFLRAIGYTPSDAQAILLPQASDSARWWRPDGATAPVPNGKVKGRGVWSLEFNRPSLIRAFGHAYEWAGQGNYSKAMPKFQTTVLSDQHKVDFFGVSHLGGRVYNTGFNEDGLLIQGNTIRDLASNRDLNTEIAGIGGLAGDQELLQAFPTEFEDLTVTRRFTSTGEAIFNDVTLNGNIEGSPTWADGVLPDATRTQKGIIRLATPDEAKRFISDDTAISPATLIDAVGSALKGVCNLRISLQNNTPYPLADINSAALFIHPYRGSEIALYSTTLRRWTVVPFSGMVEVPLAPCNAANTIYDVYLYNAGTDLAPVLSAAFVAWSGNNPPNRANQDGIFCRSGNPSQRLVGVVRTDDQAGWCRTRLGGVIPAGNSAQFPRIGVANFDHPYTCSMRYFFGTSWNTPGVENWATPRPYSVQPRCELLLADTSLVTAYLDIYSNPLGKSAGGASTIAYVAPGINTFAGPPDDAFYGETGHIDNQTANSQWSRSMTHGVQRIYYLYCQKGLDANVINEHAAHGMIVTSQV
jgi:hypothetical protein